MNAKLYAFPFPSIERQKMVRESLIVQAVMDKYMDKPYPLVAHAIGAARNALDSDMSAEEALEAADKAIKTTVLRFTKELK